MTGKVKHFESNLPTEIKTETNEKINCIDQIAENFNDFFVNVGKNLAEKIDQSSTNFESYLNVHDSKMIEFELSMDELEKAFKTLKSNKSEGLDEINVNIVRSVFDIIKTPLLSIFNLSLKEGIFPKSLKYARVVPVYKNGDRSTVSNYRPISILPCLSKLLERIMYNRLYDYLVQNNILYNKQFGFQNGHSTDHAVIQLVDEIMKSFDQNLFTLGIFIDLSKAFDTVDHKILTKKLELYGIKNNNLNFFKSYLSDRKQGVSFNNTHSQLKPIVCGVPQGSILGPLLFLIYVNDLYLSSKLLHFILFADDTNLFFSHKNLKTLFFKMNAELSKINEWFKANKLSLNVTKTKFILFLKSSKVDDIPLKLPDLNINNINIKRVNSMKFLGVILDQHLNWNEHLKLIENKTSKCIGIMHRS